MRRHQPTWLLLLGCAGVVTACGPSPATSPSPSGSASARPSRSATASPIATGPVLTGTITITGAYAAEAGPTDAFTTRAEVETGGSATAAPAGFTCADYAHGTADAQHNGLRTFAAPAFQTALERDGTRPVTFGAAIDSGYAGPGTYQSTALPSLTGHIVVDVGQFIDWFFPVQGGTTSLTVNPDGSGTLTYTSWYSTGSTSRESGTVTWTCRDV